MSLYSSRSCHSGCSLWKTWIQKAALDINLTADGSDRLAPHFSSTKLEYIAALHAELLQCLSAQQSPVPCRMAPVLHGLVLHGSAPGCCWPTDSHRQTQTQQLHWETMGEASLPQKPCRELLWTQPHLLSWLPTAGKVDKISKTETQRNIWYSNWTFSQKIHPSHPQFH